MTPDERRALAEEVSPVECEHLMVDREEWAAERSYHAGPFRGCTRCGRTASEIEAGR